MAQLANLKRKNPTTTKKQTQDSTKTPKTVEFKGDEDIASPPKTV